MCRSYSPLQYEPSKKGPKIITKVGYITNPGWVFVEDYV